MAAKYELFPIIKICCFAWMWNDLSSNLPHRGFSIKASWPKQLFAKKGGGWGWLRYTWDSMVGLLMGEVPATHSEEGGSVYFPSSGLGCAGGRGVTILGFTGIWSLSHLLSSALVACEQPQMTCKQCGCIQYSFIYENKNKFGLWKESCWPCPRMLVLIFYGFFLPSLLTFWSILSLPLSSTTTLSSLFICYRAILSFFQALASDDI